MLLAQVQPQPTTDAIGLWVVIAMLLINGVAATIGVLALFATRRDVDQLTKHIDGIAARVEEVDADLQAYKQKVNDNGELRKNFIINHIDDKQSELRAELARVHDRIDKLKG